MRLLRVLFILLIFVPLSVYAGNKQSYTLDEMAAKIHKQSGAQILSADVQQTEQGKVYRFKVKKKGRVRVLLMKPDGTPIKQK